MKVRTVRVFGRTFEYWYNMGNSVWYAIEKDADGNQIGETIDAAKEQMILIFIGVRAGESKEQADSGWGHLDLNASILAGRMIRK